MTPEEKKEKKRLYDIEYRKKNAEKKKELNKKWREENKEKKKELDKKWYEENKEKKKEYDKEYNQKNAEKKKEYNKEYRQKNKTIIKEKKKIYNEINKDKINEYQKKKKLENPLYKLTCSIRSSIKEAIKRKGGIKLTKTELILGCSFEYFKKHIETLWSHPNNLDENGNVWMNWDNYGNPKDGILEPNKTWDFDHIIPISNANTLEEIHRLNHHSNIQPLCSYYNRIIKRNNPL